MSIIPMEYLSNCQTFGGQYYEKAKEENTTAKTATSSDFVHIRPPTIMIMIIGSQPESANQKRP